MAEERRFIFKNFARSTLGAGLAASDSQVAVATGQGDRFPLPVVEEEEIFALILESSTQYEIAYCTARFGDTLTVERGKEGTSAQDWALGATIVHAPTAGVIEAIQQSGERQPSAVVLTGEIAAANYPELSWTASVPGGDQVIEAYEIYRSVDGGAFALLDTVDSGTLIYEDHAVTTTTDYSYYVVAIPDVGVDSPASNTVELSTGSQQASAVVLTGELVEIDEVDLEWTESTPAGGSVIVSYDIYRSEDGGDFALLTSVDADDPREYSDASLDDNVTYSYYVVAIPDVGLGSEPSNTVEFYTPQEEYLVALTDNERRVAISTDAITWVDSSGTWVTNAFMYDICYSPSLGQLIAVGATDRLVYSEDGGQTWTDDPLGQLENYESCLWVEQFSKFYVGSNNGQGFYNDNATGAWTAITTGGRVFDIAYSEELDMVVFVGNNNDASDLPHVVTSTNGTTFTSRPITGMHTGSNPGSALMAVAWDSDRALWFACNHRGNVYYTADIVAGVWTESATGLLTASAELRKLAIKPGGGSEPICYATGASIYRSVDGGANWTETSTVNAACVLWSPYLRKFVAVAGNQIYHSPDGVTWTLATTLPATNNYTALCSVLVP